jgi:Co/Zn/Cd efflux system component
VLIGRWGFGLMRESAAILLDAQAPAPLLAAISQAIESDGDARISDLHVWTHRRRSLCGAGVAGRLPAASPRRLQGASGGIAEIVHLAVEVNRCPGPH